MKPGSPVRLRILVQGTVQRVGYPHIIQGIARRNQVAGCIRNLEGYDVEIIAEGRPDNLQQFTTDIRIQEFPISVEHIEVSEGQYTGEYSYFEIIRGSPEDELAERFDSAIAIFSRMEKKQDVAIDLGRETVSLQKETLNEVKGITSLQKETLNEVKGITSLQRETLALQKETLDEVKGIASLQKETRDEVKGVRQDLSKTLTQEIAEMREELKEIRSALIQAGIMKLAHS